jgi:hypothetical protein
MYSQCYMQDIFGWLCIDGAARRRWCTRPNYVLMCAWTNVSVGGEWESVREGGGEVGKAAAAN